MRLLYEFYIKILTSFLDDGGKIREKFLFLELSCHPNFFIQNA